MGFTVLEMPEPLRKCRGVAETPQPMAMFTTVIKINHTKWIEAFRVLTGQTEHPALPVRLEIPRDLLLFVLHTDGILEHFPV